MNHNNQLDFFRAILIVLVILIHIVNFGDHYPLLKNAILAFLMPSFLRQFGIRIRLEKFQLPTLFNAHWQCLGLILEETVCSQCRTEIHEEVMYGAMA